jgi:hypothetical protein
VSTKPVTYPGLLGPRLAWERLPGQVSAIAPGKAALASRARCAAQAVIIDKITGNRVDIGTEGKAIPDALTNSQSDAVKGAACVRRLCLLHRSDQHEDGSCPGQRRY